MERIEHHYYCDACGKEVYRDDDLKHCEFEVTVFKTHPECPYEDMKIEHMMIYEICRDCYKKIEDAFVEIMKKTNEEGE